MKTYQTLLAATLVIAGLGYGAKQIYHRGLEKGITIGTERGTLGGRLQMKEEALYQLKKHKGYLERDIEWYTKSDPKFKDLQTKAEARLDELEHLGVEINYIPHWK